MKGLTAAVALVLCALALPLGAVAASGGGQPAFHDRVFDDAGTDDDFCGTGETINFVGRAVINGWVGETGGDPEQVVKAAFSYRYTITNPATGAAVVDSAAGEDTNVIVAGQESGPHTHEFTAKGLRGKLQAANGPVLLRDAGSITYRVSFDENDEFTGLEIVRVSGPHPGLGTDAWCDAAVEALGL
jgi:hypothetical protein